MSFATATRTIAQEVRDPDFAAVVDALGLQAKNIGNTAIFLIRNVRSALQEDGSLRGDLHANQRQAVDEANAAVRAINAKRQAKHEREDADKRKPLKTLPLFGADEASQRAKASAMLDPTLLDTMVRAHRDADGDSPYAAIPAACAQQVLRDVLDAYKGYFEALKGFRKHPESFTGRPRPPGYRDKHARIPLTYPAALLQRADGLRLIALGDKVVPTDYGKSCVLSDRQKTSYAAYQLESVIAGMRSGRKVPADAKLCEVRLVPLRGGVCRVDAVFSFPLPLPLPESSLAHRLYTELEQEQPELKASKVNDALVAKLGQIAAEALPRMVGADVGLNNLISLAFSQGSRGMVLSNSRIEQHLQQFDRRLDSLKSRLTPQAVKDLQAKREKESLTPAELHAMKRGLAAVYRDPDYVQWLSRRTSWLSDALHKVSAGIVKELQQRRIEVLVIGLNKGWKDEVNMGRQQNRRMLAAAHTRLVELLRYKCLAAGILVVTTEESYTSKTSFVLDEPLQARKEKRNKGKTTSPSHAEPTTGETPPARETETTGKEVVVLQGRRGTGKKRHVFTSPGLSDTARATWATIHADLNGAYNMLRKVFPAFRWHAQLHAKAWLYWLSPKAGLTPMRLGS